MNRIIKTLLICVLSIGFGSAGSAQQRTFLVEYTFGTVEFRTGSSWKPVLAGDSLPEDAVLRLAPKSIAEIRQAGRRLSFIREGTYFLSSLVSAGSIRPGLAEILLRKLRTLVESDGKSITVAGVRASEAAGTQGYSSGGDEAKKSGIAALEAGDYASAILKFGYSLDEAITPAEEDDVRILLATAYALADRPGAALGILHGISAPVPATNLLKASLLLRAGAPEEALSLARSVSASPASQIQAAEAAELEGLCLETLDKKREAVEAYRKASAAAPDSKTAERARERLAALEN